MKAIGFYVIGGLIRHCVEIPSLLMSIRDNFDDYVYSARWPGLLGRLNFFDTERRPPKNPKSHVTQSAIVVLRHAPSNLIMIPKNSNHARIRFKHRNQQR